MNKVICHILVLCLLLQPMSRLSYSIGYQINRTFIAKNYCVNKAKPQLKCFGKCYLIKSLKKAEDDQRNSHSGLNDEENHQINQISKAFIHLALHFRNIIFCYQAFVPKSAAAKIFQPPRTC